MIGISSKTKNSDDNIFFFKSYEDLFQSNEINAVYISTLNNTHKNLVKEAFKYNKKILCEKPLGMNFNEVKELYELFKNTKNDLIEAIAYRSHPQTFSLLDLLKDKEFTLKDKPNETFIGKGIDNKGLLIAQNLKDQRMVKFSSGEVSLKLKK